jgi:hypothetical protein
VKVSVNNALLEGTLNWLLAAITTAIASAVASK